MVGEIVVAALAVVGVMMRTQPEWMMQPLRVYARTSARPIIKRIIILLDPLSHAVVPPQFALRFIRGKRVSHTEITQAGGPVVGLSPCATGEVAKRDPATIMAVTSV